MEKKFNLLLANENTDEITLLSERLTNDENISSIDIATNGKDASESISSKHYDLII